ncbi:S-layer homology domain-containing protein [Selenomonas sputigena]|uniref:S-layer homology domain-containing protein n=1 Tax=Selenomonas sputigena TaxID=69823 RepID=UPI002233EF01|nr:S-layer homology domain-containing protein [Selenomonas sputigena]UZE44899.1 S-layer homology domain-containing protein [Selenomonas sputigena]
MRFYKKRTALLALAFAALSATAFAADGADRLSDVPKDHWSYEALDYLAKNGVIEGYADGTFQGNRTMSRYEMAAITARAMQASNLDIGARSVLEKLEKEYGSELATLRAQVEQNTEDIRKNREAIERFKVHGFVRTQYDYDKNTDADTLDRSANRFYMDLRLDMKVNDIWTVKAQSETNRHYNNGHLRGENAMNENAQQTWSGHDGNFQRIWVEAQQDGRWLNLGRAWRGLGFQNVLFGNESDGFQFGIPIKGTNLTASGFWMASTGAGNKESLYGVGLWGAVGHNFDINVAYARSSLGKNESYTSGLIDHYEADPVTHRVFPVYRDNDRTNPRSYGYVVSAATNVAKNVRVIGDYVQTDADEQNKSVALRLNYKGTKLDDVGSFGVYARYVRYGANGWLAGDDEWGSTWNGTKGWIVGFKYVPWKNVEWETLFSRQKRDYGTSAEYNRSLLRTQLDYHF